MAGVEPTMRVDLSTMIRKRGAPVLVELIRKHPAGVGGDAPMAPYPVAEAPRASAGVTEHNLHQSAAWEGAAAAGSQNKDWRLLAIIAASVIALVALVAVIAYKKGQTNEGDKWAQMNAGSNPGETPVGPVPKPVDPLIAPEVQPDGGSPLGKPFDPSGRVVVPEQPQNTTENLELQVGWNYLVAATLNRADAELAAQYLVQNGLPVKLVPKDRVDPNSARANNGLWQVLILRGVPRDQYTKRRTEREALTSQVQRLGKKWKAENKKAPTDFAEPYWELRK